ncbi:hypothetical protein C8R43DRAFT_1110337 [Mycena crocata]|nr:hypothetical protein C8R43DRAFT_1110337 [Mycena crocata]
MSSSNVAQETVGPQPAVRTSDPHVRLDHQFSAWIRLQFRLQNSTRGVLDDALSFWSEVRIRLRSSISASAAIAKYYILLSESPACASSQVPTGCMAYFNALTEDKLNLVHRRLNGNLIFLPSLFLPSTTDSVDLVHFAMGESWTLLTSTGLSLQPAEAETKTIKDPGCAADESTHRGQEGLRGEMEDRDTNIRRAEGSVTSLQQGVVPAQRTRVFLSGTLQLVASEDADSHDLSADDTTIARDATDISHDGSDTIWSHPTRTE